MSNHKTINDDDIIKYAKEQLDYHSQKAKYWELVVNASNKQSKNSGTITSVSLPSSTKKKNLTLLNQIKEAFKKYGVDLKLAKQWYEILKADGISITYITFLSSLGEFVKGEDIARIEVPNVPNKIKYWYGLNECLDENKILKSEYKTALEENIKKERNDSSLF